MPKLVLYGVDLSPPVRACLLTFHALDLPFEYKIVNLQAGEHLSEDFLNKNPQHTLPVLDDDGTFLVDSHAICSYLVDKYGKSDALYPKDLLKRAHLQQRLYFDASVLFPSMRNITLPFFVKNVTQVPPEKMDNVRDGYEHLEKFLGDNLYVTGDSLTIADFCCAATISSLHGILDVDAVKYPKMHAWLDRMAELPYYHEANAVGAEQFKNIMKNGLTIV